MRDGERKQKAKSTGRKSVRTTGGVKNVRGGATSKKTAVSKKGGKEEAPRKGAAKKKSGEARGGKKGAATKTGVKKAKGKKGTGSKVARGKATGKQGATKKKARGKERGAVTKKSAVARKGGRGKAGDETPEVISFSTPEVASAFKQALKKYPSALKRLRD